MAQRQQGPVDSELTPVASNLSHAHVDTKAPTGQLKPPGFWNLDATDLCTRRFVEGVVEPVDAEFGHVFCDMKKTTASRIACRVGLPSTVQQGTSGVIITISTRWHYREAGRKSSLNIPIFLRFVISSVVHVSIQILDENKHRNQRNKKRLATNA